MQPASNTRFEFVLKYCSDLDKIPISQHAGDILHHYRPASLKTVRFGFCRFELGLGNEVRDRVAPGDSSLGRGRRKPCGGSVTSQPSRRPWNPSLKLPD